VFSHRGEWCDFCSAQQVLWSHVRFAVPVYVVLFYLPMLLSWLIGKLRAKGTTKMGPRLSRRRTCDTHSLTPARLPEREMPN